MRPFNKTTATLVRTHPFSTLCPTPLGKSPVCMLIHDNCTMGIAVVHLEEPSRCKFPGVQPRQCLGESSGSPTVAATATRHHSGRTIHRPAPQARHGSGV